MHFGDTRVSLADVDPRDVTGMLRATGSTDPDVLFAAKTEYGRTFKIQKMVGLSAMIMGVCSVLMIVLAIVGIPVIAFGFWCWRKGSRNLAGLEATYSTYAATVTPVTAASRPITVLT
jgi:hypothetical protein